MILAIVGADVGHKHQENYGVRVSVIGRKVVSLMWRLSTLKGVVVVGGWCVVCVCGVRVCWTVTMCLSRRGVMEARWSFMLYHDMTVHTRQEKRVCIHDSHAHIALCITLFYLQLYVVGFFLTLIGLIMEYVVERRNDGDEMYAIRVGF